MLAQYVYYFNQNLDLLTFHVQGQTERLSPDLTSTRCTAFEAVIPPYFRGTTYLVLLY
jgi:hypothetical protein